MLLIILCFISLENKIKLKDNFYFSISIYPNMVTTNLITSHCHYVKEISYIYTLLKEVIHHQFKIFFLSL